MFFYNVLPKGYFDQWAGPKPILAALPPRFITLGKDELERYVKPRSRRHKIPPDWHFKTK